MTRRRWIYINGEAIEVTDDYEAPSRDAKHNALAGDRHYDGMRAPDGADISTRSKHRDYMKANGLTTVDDFKDTWARAEKSRDAYRTNGIGGAVTRDDVGRAIYNLERRR